MVEIKPKLADRIIRLLEKTPHLRDSDDKLIANLWYSDSLHMESKMEFLEAYSKGLITNPISVVRIRRQVQKKDAGLRGVLYEKRLKKEEQIKDQLGYRISD